jgi:hypothetical protein
MAVLAPKMFVILCLITNSMLSGLISAWRRLNAQSTKSQTRYVETHLVMTAVLGVFIDFDKGFMNLGQVDAFC